MEINGIKKYKNINAIKIYLYFFIIMISASPMLIVFVFLFIQKLSALNLLVDNFLWIIVIPLCLIGSCIVLWIFEFRNKRYLFIKDNILYWEKSRKKLISFSHISRIKNSLYYFKVWDDQNNKISILKDFFKRNKAFVSIDIDELLLKIYWIHFKSQNKKLLTFPVKIKYRYAVFMHYFSIIISALFATLFIFLSIYFYNLFFLFV